MKLSDYFEKQLNLHNNYNLAVAFLHKKILLDKLEHNVPILKDLCQAFLKINEILDGIDELDFTTIQSAHLYYANHIIFQFIRKELNI